MLSHYVNEIILVLMIKNNYKKIIVNTENHYFFWIFYSIDKVMFLVFFCNSGGKIIQSLKILI